MKDHMTESFKAGVQVEASHYQPYRYLNPQRMASIGWQLRLMVEHFPRSTVLEIGGGGGLTKQLLKEEGFQVYSLDIDPELQPDIVGSLTDIQVKAASFDAVLCCQVLEHLPWEESIRALREMHRVCRIGCVISVPTVQRLLAFSLFGPRRDGFRIIKGVHFGAARRRCEAEHYWELAAGVTEKEFRGTLVNTGFTIEQDFRPITWFYHHFFVLKKV